MKALPPSFPAVQLQEVLETHWRLKVRELEYLPLGFGAHHWRASTPDRGDLFVTVHDLDLFGRCDGDRRGNFEFLRQAFRTTRWLQSVAELDFVVGPLPESSDEVVRVFADQYAISICPWIDATPLDDPDGAQTADLVAQLHRVTHHLPRELGRTEDFLIPHRAAMQLALQDLDRPWRTGPYAEPARAQLRHHTDSIRALFAFYDHVAELSVTCRADWVLTHGEPGGPNLLRSSDGTLHLVDWDTALIAPAERDLWDLPRTAAAQAAYRRVVDMPIVDDRLRLYEAWYALAELCVYVAQFLVHHVGDENDVTSWENFLRFLPAPSAGRNWMDSHGPGQSIACDRPTHQQPLTDCHDIAIKQTPLSLVGC